jgi:hypothetical protein
VIEKRAKLVGLPIFNAIAGIVTGYFILPRLKH